MADHRVPQLELRGVEFEQELSRQRSSPKYKPESISPGPKTCIACHKSELLSEIIGVCCRNCSIALEPPNGALHIQTEGSALPAAIAHPGSVRTDAVHATDQLTSNPSVLCPIFRFISVIATLAVQAHHCLQTILGFGAPLLPYFYALFFLGFPSHYASESSALLTLLDGSRSDYEQWVDARGIHPTSLVKLHKAWEDYLQAHSKWWKVLLVVACASPVAPPAVLANLGMKDDPVSRHFVFLAVYCSMNGILFNLIFLLFSRKCRRSLRYAFVWAQEAKKSDTAMWRMIALPDVATFWAMISHFVVVSIVMWRDDSPHSPSPNAGAIGLVGRMFVTSIILIDAGCLLWAMKYYTRLIEEAAKERQGDAGSDAERGL